MTPRSTDVPNLTSEEAPRLYLTGGAQDAPRAPSCRESLLLESRSFVTVQDVASLTLVPQLQVPLGLR